MSVFNTTNNLQLISVPFIYAILQLRSQNLCYHLVTGILSSGTEYQCFKWA